MDDREGRNLGRWGLVFGLAGAAIAFVMLVVPLVVFLFLWWVGRGLPPTPGD